MPNEIISYILKLVILNEGEYMISRLSVGVKEFRRSAHFTCKVSIIGSLNAFENFRRTYFVMYDVKRCQHCRILYKEMLGFDGRGKLGENRHFYSELSFPGYCGAECCPDINDVALSNVSN